MRGKMGKTYIRANQHVALGGKKSESHWSAADFLIMTSQSQLLPITTKLHQI